MTNIAFAAIHLARADILGEANDSFAHVRLSRSLVNSERA
jgi:hypothetical protein